MSFDGTLAAAGIQAAPRRLSEVLRALAQGTSGRITVGDLLAGLQDRGFAPLLVLFALPNVVLFVPGSSFVSGIALIVLSLQLAIGRRTVWLPERLRAHSIDSATFARIATASLPTIERIERMARPRLWPRDTGLADRLIGIVSLSMAVLVCLPVPFGNALPGLAIALMAIGLGERDGVWLSVGLGVGAIAVSVVVAVLFTGALAVLKVFS